MAIAPDSRRLLRLPLLALALAGTVAHSEEGFQFSVDAGVGTTDNILRSPDDEQSEEMGLLGTRLSLQQTSRRLEADLLADLMYVHYSDGTYSNEVTGNFIGSANLAVVPDRITWIFEDNFGQAVTDPLAAVTPDNQENVNVFATGPDFFMPLGATNSLGFSARFMNTDFEENPFGSERYSGMLYFGRELSSSAMLSVRGSVEQVTPEDESLSEEYDQSELYARYSIDGSRTTFAVEGGTSRIERGDFSDSSPLLRLALSREFTTRSTLRATFGREYSDSGSALRFEQAFGGVDTDTSAVTSNSEPFLSTFANLEWSVFGRRTQLGLTAGYSDSEYLEDTTFNRSRWQFGARAGRDLGPRLTLNLRAGYSSEDVAAVDGDSTETSLGTGLSWRAGRNVFIDLSYEHTERSSDNPAFEFAENRAWLRLRYGVEPARRQPGAAD
jgi:hypothetical protein